MEGKRILVVEKDKRPRKIACRALTATKSEVDAAEDKGDVAVFEVGYNQIFGRVVIGRDDHVRLPCVDEVFCCKGRLLFKRCRSIAFGIHIEEAQIVAAVGRVQFPIGRESDVQFFKQSFLDLVAPFVTTMVGVHEQDPLAGFHFSN